MFFLFWYLDYNDCFFFTDVTIVIHREGKSLSYAHIEQTYQEWVLNMHNNHDEEAAAGEDEAVLIVGSLDKKALGILRDGMY